MIFLVMLTAPVGLLIGGLIAFVWVPIYYRLTGTAPVNRTIGFVDKILVTLIVTAVFSGGVCGLEYLNKMGVRDDYMKFQGEKLYWRMPLEHPYELCMRGSMDVGYIGAWKQDGRIVDNIVGFEKRGTVVAGQLEKDEEGRDVWFVFRCDTGAVETYRAFNLFYSACSKAGMQPPVKIETVRHNWYVYWGIVED